MAPLLDVGNGAATTAAPVGALAAGRLTGAAPETGASTLWFDHGNRMRLHIGVESKLFRANANYVTSTEDLHRDNALAVDKNPVRARVAEDVADIARRDFGVAAGDLRGGDHDVTARIAAKRDAGSAGI